LEAPLFGFASYARGRTVLKPGELIGPYEIRGFVGQGGMGQVYRAFDPRLERTVALKIIIIPDSARDVRTRPDGARNAERDSGRLLSGSPSEFSARLLREARAVAALSHPNVVAIYDVGESKGRLYLAMELVVGASLRSFVGNLEIPLARRIGWLVDVARALDAAHKSGIVHRDVKPENVMVREDSGIKVLDFGIARRTAPRTSDEQHAVDTVTGGGAITGTPVYMAPEQIKGGDVDARCDQFAWGVMAYELVTGERPWADTGDLLSLVAKILTDPVRPVRVLAKEVPPVVEETLHRALSKDPAARFATMTDVVEALEPFVSVSSVSSRRDRIKIAPSTTDDPAYAATTRVPMTVSVEPPKTDGPTARTARPQRSAWSLALPLALLGALVGAVYVVRTRVAGKTIPTTPSASVSGPRPLSPVPRADAAYREAMSLWHDGASAKATMALKQAIELDPTFAAAHLQLALQQASANDIASAQASFQSAYEHRHMLTHRDSVLLEASQPFVRAKPDVEEWETRMTAVIFQYTRDAELQFYLGRARERQGDFGGARAAYADAIRLDGKFVPALAAMATADAALGKVPEALGTTERCIARTPIASLCVETRYALLFGAGQCKRAREEANHWASLEPQSPRPFAALARALHADNAPRASVEEVLSRRWTLVPAADKKLEELRDRASLAVIEGDLAKAEEIARDVDAALPLSADAYDHAIPARLRVNALMELDRMKDAAKAAHQYLDRMDAWPAYPFAPSPSVGFLEPLFRTGEIDKRELVQRRSDWLQAEKRRANEARTTALDPWVSWATVYGSFAETREEAIEALAEAPKDKPGPRGGLFVDFTIGKTFALAGRSDDALPFLSRVTSTCSTFDAPMQIAKAHLLMGQILEAKGDIPGARAHYERITESWPKTTGSRTTKRALERLSMLTRD
jgi:eukaryotic-like serine/threonine-protein kinase